MLSVVRSLSDRHCSLTSLARHKAKMAAFSGMVLVTMLLMVIVNRPSTGGDATVMQAPSPVVDTKRVFAEQQRRQRAISAHCSVRPSSEDDLTVMQLRNIYVLDDYQTLYCKVPKVACTNWKKVLLMIAGQLTVDEAKHVLGYDVHHTLELKYLKTLDQYSKDEIEHRLKSYFKFVFVRHPFDRLVSAYRNKFNNSLNTVFPEIYGRQIIRNYRPNADNASLSTGQNVTFEEFLRFAIDTHPAKQNEHWQVYDYLCSFCAVNYDFIGNYETLDSDARFVLNRIGGRHISFPKAPPVRSHVWTGVFANLSRELVRQVWEKYSEDFEMFNYEYPPVR